MPTAVLPSMVSGVHDTEQTLLVKLVYWLQTAAEALGGTNSYTMLLPSMAANANDSKQALLVKAAYWAEQIAGAVAGGVGSDFYTFGSGAPPVDGSVTTQGYWNLDDSTAWVNTAWPDTATPTWEAH